MKLKFMDAPGKLTIGSGDDPITLLIRPMKGGERAAMVDACATGSLSIIQRACESMVDDWMNVCREDGTPVPRFSAGVNGETTSNFGRVLEAMGGRLHLETLTAIIAYLGMPTGDTERFAKMFPGPEIDSTPTAPQVDKTPLSASGS